MNSDPADSGSALDEQLVAYLDGELDAENSRRIEALLASDAEVRRRLQSLERTWDLLDELDAAPVGEPFTQTTLEMVAIAAHEDVERDRADAPRRRRRRLLTAGWGLLAAAAAGFLAVVLSTPDPNRQLLEDLPLLENFDEYRQVENVEFLHALRDNDLFSRGGSELPAAAATKVEDLPARRHRVDGMGPGEKEQLLRVEERFIGLNPEEQQRLRQLDEQLQADPDAQRLRAIMRRYGEWLKTLSSYNRAELAEMKLAERVGWIQKEEQRREGSRRPGGKDMEVLLKWMNEYAARHEKQFLERLPEPQRERFSQLSEPMRRRMVLSQVWQRRQAVDAGQPPPMTDEDLARLRQQLSLETRNRLEALPPAKQWELVANWLRQGMRRPGRGVRGPPPMADDERLAEFFEKELSNEERDRLLSLHGEEMQHELQRLFLRGPRPTAGPRFRPEDSSFGPWPRERPVPKKPENTPQPSRQK